MERRTKRTLASLTKVHAIPRRDGMKITAGFTLLGAAGSDLLILSDRQDDPIDAVA
jgi:hypothetical protein